MKKDEPGNRAGKRKEITGLAGGPAAAIEVLLDSLPTDREGHPMLGGIPLLKKLGAGGMSAVYRGLHPRLDIEVAVKILPFHLADAAPKVIKRFFTEAKMAARVMSPHVVNVLDVNENAGIFYIVMEYVNGVSAGYLLRKLQSGYPVLPITLADLIVAEGMPPERIGLPEISSLEIIHAASKGLAVAHDNDVIHRDVKIDNIMLPRMRDTGPKGPLELKKAKLADLGLARRGDMAGGQSTMGMGTPGYLSPEQVRAPSTMGKPSDIFSMGSSLYTLLAGQPPFAGKGIGDVVMKTIHEPHPPIQQLCPHVSGAVSDLLDRCLAKEPAERYPDGESLADALDGVIRTLRAIESQKPIFGEGSNVRIEITGWNKTAKKETKKEKKISEPGHAQSPRRSTGGRRKTGKRNPVRGTAQRQKVSAKRETEKEKKISAPAPAQSPRRSTGGRRKTGKRNPVSGTAQRQKVSTPRTSTTGPRRAVSDQTRERRGTSRKRETAGGLFGAISKSTGLPRWLIVSLTVAAAIFTLLIIALLFIIIGSKPDQPVPDAGQQSSAARPAPQTAPSVKTSPMPAEKPQARRQSSSPTKRKPEKERQEPKSIAEDPISRWPGDADGDGLPDEWERLFGLNPSDISDAAADTDGDGFINIQEFVAGSDPSSPDSRPAVHTSSVIRLGKGSLVFDGGMIKSKPDADLFSTSSLILESHPSGADCERVFIKYDLSLLSSAGAIVSAELVFKISEQGKKSNTIPRRTVPLTVRVGAVDTGIENLDNRTWNTLKNVGIVSGTETDTLVTRLMNDVDADRFDVTKIVRYWLRNPGSNHGFLLHIQPETWKHVRREWISSEFQGGRRCPLLEVAIRSDKENRPPVIRSPVSGTVVKEKAGSTLHLQANAFDPDGEKLRYAWDADAADGLDFKDSGSRTFYYTDYKKQGKRIAVLKVTDSAGNERFSAVVVEVEP